MLLSKKNYVLSAVVTVLVLSLALTGCGSISGAVKSFLRDEAFPTLPPAEIATYVLDLSGSTNAIAQLNALNSGIDEFVSGKSLGNPFSKPKVKPLGLSMQFITLSSGQAPRFLLVSAEASHDLYNWMVTNIPNINQAEPLWKGFIRAREIVYADKTYVDLQSCVNKSIELFGKQSKSAEVLQIPARIICIDASKTASALESLQNFTDRPDVPLGSDVFGAVRIAVNNMTRASEEFGGARVTIAIASDMIDENPKRKMMERLVDKNFDACKTGNEYSVEDFGEIPALSNLRIVLVSLENTSMYKNAIENNRIFWKCYFQKGGAEVKEAPDLAGY